MQNPLNSVPLLNPAVPEGTFRRNFVKGVGSGALMMGIFGTLTLTTMAVGTALAISFLTPAGGLVAAALHLIPTIGIGSIATGLFSGVTATQRAADAHSSAKAVSHNAERLPVRAPEHSVAPTVERAAHNSREWQNKVTQGSHKGRDNVSKILADRSLTDGDRASAILRDREQSNTLNASR